MLSELLDGGRFFLGQHHTARTWFAVPEKHSRHV